MSQPAPTASGTLAATPLGHLLIYALDRHLSGTIVFEEPDHRKHAVHFVRGAATAARTASVVAPLGELAVERGMLSAERLEAALTAAREAGQRLGELLIEWVLLDAAGLEALLREQVARRVTALQLLPAETAYGFYEGTNFLERAGGPSQPCAPLPLILRVMRRSPATSKANDAFARLSGTLLRFHVEAPLAHFDFEPGEKAVVDVLRAKPQTLSELAGRGLLEPSALEHLLHTLLLLRHFEMGTGTQPVGAERRSVTPAAHSQPPLPTAPSGTIAAAPAPAADTRPAADDAFRREILERSSADNPSHYEVLGVAPDDPGIAIASAYFQLAKRWHPDRLAPEHADLRDAAMRIFARIGEAHQVLSDADRRREYDASFAENEESAEDQEQVQRVLRAATNFQKAQVLLRRNNLPAAEEAARLALQEAPEEADHVALVAWLSAMKPGADLAVELRAVDRAVKAEPTNLRVRWYRGQLLKRLGKERLAQEDFRMIVEKDPRHVDAQRELRLFEMQRGQRKSSSDAPTAKPAEPGQSRTPPPGPGDKAGFFGKLFKK